MQKRILYSFLTLIFTSSIFAQIPKAPERKEGDGPFSQLIIRGVILINGTGAPPVGPMDIVIEKNRIVDIVGLGSPGIKINPNDRPKLKEGGKELNCEGMYALPGFIDMHGHIGGVEQGTPAEYVFKLWMAHGITTIRDPSCGNGLDWVLDEKQKSLQNLITDRIIFV
jgi:adenine deaminase